MNYLSFKEFVDEFGLKDEATYKVKIKEILSELNIPVGIYMRDDAVTTKRVNYLCCWDGCFVLFQMDIISEIDVRKDRH